MFGCDGVAKFARFSTFFGIDLCGTNMHGVIALLRNSKHAETGELNMPKSYDRELGSLFEEETADAQRKLGYPLAIRSFGGGNAFRELSLTRLTPRYRLFAYNCSSRYSVQQQSLERTNKSWRSPKI